ncbi:hypothetical protein JRO89_XS12G0187400 [Xanthoceras sorbifolium]|uniref:Uncharacterized protein n=1 Tax=Xanthoceras sorbifolium TaxID=99658 RepID=A0ABQ8HD13_9ROSI|nr:hypothetical protein JRO89_XS12G0187400 [Xanthoceras sorbifolium]
MPVHGVTETTLKLGSWQGNCSMMVVFLGDFDLIFCIEFFMKAKVTLMPYLRGIFIEDEQNSCFIQTEKSGTRDSKKGKGGYVAALAALQFTFLEHLKQQAEVDLSYTKLRQKVQQKRAPPVIRKEFDKQIEKMLNHRSVGESRKLRQQVDQNDDGSERDEDQETIPKGQDPQPQILVPQGKDRILVAMADIRVSL